MASIISLDRLVRIMSQGLDEGLMCNSIFISACSDISLKLFNKFRQNSSAIEVAKELFFTIWSRGNICDQGFTATSTCVQLRFVFLLVCKCWPGCEVRAMQTSNQRTVTSLFFSEFNGMYPTKTMLNARVWSSLRDQYSSFFHSNIYFMRIQKRIVWCH